MALRSRRHFCQRGNRRSNPHSAPPLRLATPAQRPLPAAGRGAHRRPGADRRHAPTVKHLGVNEVNLIFTVTDKHGHYIPNLQQSDFALLDDQKAPAKVNSFHQQINLPLRVGIVIDASTSIRSRFQFEQQSATEFLLDMLKAKQRPRLRDGLRRNAHGDAGLDQQHRRA
jgi:Ca-activated chloride channel family protein